MKEDLVARVGLCVRKLEDLFAESPYAFHSENSMHCHLYLLLTQEGLNSLLPTSAGFVMYGVQNEYPPVVPGDSPRRGLFDLVVFDQNSARQVIEYNHRRDDCPVSPRMAFELGLNKFKGKVEKLKLEMTRLSNPENGVGRGVVLYFYRYVAGHEERYEATKTRLVEIAESFDSVSVRVTAVYVDRDDSFTVKDREDLRYGPPIPRLPR